MYTDKVKSYTLGILAVLCWSTVATAFKISLSTLTITELLYISTNTAFLILAGAMLVKKKFHLLKTLSAKQWRLSILLGILNPVCYYLLLFAAYDILPAKIAQPLNFTWPLVFIFLNALIYKHKIKGLQILFAVISFAGVLVLSLDSNTEGSTSILGIFLALLSAFLWALYWIVNMRNTTDTIVSLFISFAAAALILNIAGAFLFNELPPVKGILAGVYVGFFEMGFPFLLWLYALKLAPDSSSLSQLSFLSPIFSLFFISLILGEVITLYTFLGLFLIIGGLYLNQRLAPKKS